MCLEMKNILLKLRNRVLLRIWRMRFHDFWYQSKINLILNLSSKERESRKIRRTVRLLGNFPGLWQRTIEQTPNGSCQFGCTLFVAEGDADHYIILNSIKFPRGSKYLPSVQLGSPEHVWGLHMEPEGYIDRLHYNSAEEHEKTSRFYTNSDKLIKKGGIYIASPPYVHSLVGKNWDFLAKCSKPKKTIMLGIIVSDLKDLSGHVSRIKFLEDLEASGVEFALWGRGDGLSKFKNYRGFLLNKWDAHSLCRYTICIENTFSDWYWSEKICDALLCYSLPLYHGCGKLGEFLPSDSFIPINIYQGKCIDYIKQILKEDPYNSKFDSIVKAREIILNRQNLYAFLDRELNKFEGCE